jgi:hypothetical protein
MYSRITKERCTDDVRMAVRCILLLSYVRYYRSAGPLLQAAKLLELSSSISKPSSLAKRETLPLAFCGPAAVLVILYCVFGSFCSDPPIRELFFFDGARDLDPLASNNLDQTPCGDSTVPRASDGSYCSSTMQAPVASEAGGAGVSWMRPRGVLVCSEGYWQR